MEQKEHVQKDHCYSVLIDTSRIKPCPCCGKMPAVEIEMIQSMGITNMLYTIYCSLYSCNMPQTTVATKLQDAIKAWNKLADEISGGDKNEKNNPIKEEKTDEEVEDPTITVCRDKAIEQNLPLYFIYYEETGIFKAYITETKELFEKRRCPKFLPAYKFKEIVDHYLLYYYPDWKEEHKNET